MAEYEGIERRHPDQHRIDSMDMIIRDHEKAINTLVSSTQSISQTLMSIDKQLEKTTKTLEKLADIEKNLVQYEFVKEDFNKRICQLEHSHNGDGCHTTKELSKRTYDIENTNKEQWNHIKELHEKTTKIWIYGTVAVFIATALTKIALEHLFK